MSTITGRTSVRQLHLAPQAVRALLGMKIETVSQLLIADVETLLTVRGIGAKTIARLTTLLDECKAYAFPTRIRCPRCRTLNTTATATRGEYQYRQCQHPVCRHRFRVTGSRV